MFSNMNASIPRVSLDSAPHKPHSAQTDAATQKLVIVVSTASSRLAVRPVTYLSETILTPVGPEDPTPPRCATSPRNWTGVAPFPVLAARLGRVDGARRACGGLGGRMVRQ